MAAPSNKKCKGQAITRTGSTAISGTSPENSELGETRLQLNNVIASLRILAAKLDLDVGVTDTNYFALTCDSALGNTAPTQVDVT